MTDMPPRGSNVRDATPSVFARAVVGVDGTDRGFEALRQTLALAPADASELTAVTALDTRPAVHAGVRASYWVDQLEQQAEAARAEAEALLQARAGSRARVVKGFPIDVLRGSSDELDATLLALGGQQRSRLLGIMLGDTATQLLHDGTRSVLIARSQPDQIWQPRSILVGVDGSAFSLAALRTADELATRLGATVEVISASDVTAVRPEGDWTERVDRWEAAQPVTALVERSRNVDLIIVGSRGVDGVSAIGSVSERVAHQAHCSVLVVQADAVPAGHEQPADAG